MSNSRDGLPPLFSKNPILTLEGLEREYVYFVLNLQNGNKTVTAKLLGIDRRTLYRKLERWESSNV